MAAVRMFENTAHAAAYAAFRPSYPPSVLQAICSFMTSHGSGFNLALDVACGSGQSTFFLSERFPQVVGVDISAAQVANARARCPTHQSNGRHVEFEVGSADKLPIESSSVDLVTCAQAWHWLDPARFYAEAKRVLNAKGTLAVYGYGNVELADRAGDRLVSEFYARLRRGGYWHQRRAHIDNQYKAVDLGTGGLFSVSQRRELTMFHTMSLPHFMGYVSTWSGYCSYAEAHPGNSILQDLQRGLQDALHACVDGGNDHIKVDVSHIKVDVSFPVFVIMGQK